jgi:hypothetical protein
MSSPFVGVLILFQVAKLQISGNYRCSEVQKAALSVQTSVHQSIMAHALQEQQGPAGLQICCHKASYKQPTLGYQKHLDGIVGTNMSMLMAVRFRDCL